MDGELWDTKAVAAYLGVSASTVRAYVARKQMPAPDLQLGGNWIWYAATIKEWHASRPSQQR